MMGTPVKSGAWLTKSGIPIRNLWHMLLYAWGQTRVQNQWAVEVESAPSLDGLLCDILANLIQQRMRIGLGRDYRLHESLIRGVRGRVDFTRSMRTLAFAHGQAFCRFQVFSPDAPVNQIVRSTMSRLIHVGDFGDDRARAELLRQRLRRLVRELDMVELIEVTPEYIRRVQSQRHDTDYQLMLSICAVLAGRHMPTESAGKARMPALDRDAMTLHEVFEKFVANFYRRHLSDWYVTPQPLLRWPAAQESAYLPTLRPDIVLQHRRTQRIVVLDTKFTPSVLTAGQWETMRFNRDHLFQIYAYLRSQEHRSEHHRRATGVLLYPAAVHRVSETVNMQGFQIRWETVDLSCQWEAIEGKLVEIIDSS